MAKRTTTLLAELKTLATAARENIWKRIDLAGQVLADSDWIASVHGGDEIKARDALQHEFFHELNGTYTLGVLLDIRRAFPDENVWRDHRYNLQVMRALWEEQRQDDSEPRGERKGPVARAEHDKVVEQLRHVNSRADSLAEENGRLREELRKAEQELAVLRGRVMELERLLDRQAA